MQTLTEAGVAASTVDVEAVRIGEPMLVSVDGPVQQQHERPFGYYATVVLGVVGDVAGLYWRWGFVAQCFLNNAGDQGWVGDEFVALVWVIRQQLPHKADQPSGGLVPGAGDHGGVGQHLGP